MSPVIPAFSGNGLAMRAARNLQALAGHFTVHLLVIAMHGGQEGSPSEAVLGCCASWKRILAPLPEAAKRRGGVRNWLRWGQGRLPEEWSGWTRRNDREAAAFFAETKCVRIWVFRFYLFPWAKGWLDGGGKGWLDIDELESNARESQAELLSRSGEPALAARWHEDAKACRALEKKVLRRFEQIVTSSKQEAVRLAALPGMPPVEPWPNVVPLPRNDPAAEARPDDGTWRMLFIGSLGHYPNREAIHFAAREVLPRLQALISRRVVLSVAGAGAAAYRAEFDGLPHLEWLGTIPDVAPAYARSDLVLVPLRAGGGTRIKILEAFAHHKPVVSTRLGAEGLDVEHGRELLLADDPAEMAGACAHLFHDAPRRESLAAAGRACAASQYAPEKLSALAAGLRRI